MSGLTFENGQISDLDYRLALYSFITPLCNVPQVRNTGHWTAGGCERNSTGSFYFWQTPSGRIPFDFSHVPTAGRTGAFQACDTEKDGVVIRQNGFDDVGQHWKRNFVCELP